MNHDSLDARDRKIIAVLVDNARASIREISKATGIRPSTVHQRIKRLVEIGVIEKFTVRLNDELIGEGFTGFMLIAGSTERYLGDEIMKNERVKGIYGITGEYDLLIKMKFRDMKAFNDFLLDFREKYSKHILKTLTMVQTVNLKDQ
ncbi:MAG: Lrp/AsnC family transcriptional regulator [Methanomassiliicoccales archaeon]|nr:MAG: Lrp/AsnC family transcriptional regulator [Methanomassiliicoccales archaeon]